MPKKGAPSLSNHEDPNHHFSLLVKPASADCNLRCDYCFYLDHSALYPETRIHRMPDDVLEQMVKSYMQTSQPAYSFGWQGGEPTLMGLDFFKKVVELQKKHGKAGAVVSNGLQTNATLIDDDFAAHLAEYNYLLGVSIDGPTGLHDTYRKNAAGKGSHEAVLRGIDALNRHNVQYNALVLVSSANVSQPEMVYDYLKDLGIYYHQYIPCVEFDAQGKPLPYTITGEQWGGFLIGIFEKWLATDTRVVSIRDFDAIIQLMVNGTYSMCVQGGYCNQYFVVEYNGDIYPCDFFVEKRTRLGNITKDSWDELVHSRRYHGFASLKSEWNENCSRCKYLRFCSGDCIKQRYHVSRDSTNLSRLCEGWKAFYERSIPDFERLSVDYLNGRQAEVPEFQRRVFTKPPPVRIGWNDPCYCGSGKKYRLCHGTAVSSKARQ